MARSNEKTIPLWSELYDKMLKDISTGLLKPGERLPSLNDICKRYAVSKITAIRVLEELEKDGYAEKIQGKGTFLKRPVDAFRIRLVLRLPDAGSGDYMLPVIAAYLQGIETEARENGISLEYLSRECLDNPEPDAYYIIFASDIRDCEYAEAISRVGGYAVFIHSREALASADTVRLDFRKGMEITTSYLISRGRRRIAFLGGSLESPWYAPRFKGYYTALEKAGLPLDVKLVGEVESAPSIESVARAFDRIMSDAGANPPDAFVASDDLRAIVLMNLFRQRGIKVPETFAVTGMDNRPSSRTSIPPLTTLDCQWEKQGALAVKRIIERKRGTELPSSDILLEPKLVIRESD